MFNWFKKSTISSTQISFNNFYDADEVNNLVGKKFSKQDIEKFITYIQYYMWARAKHEYNVRLYSNWPIDTSFEVKQKWWVELIDTLKTY